MHAIDAFDRDVTSALLAIAGREGWRGTTMTAIAAEAGCSPAALRARFPSREAVLRRFGTLIDVTVAATPASGETPRERLFDVLMRRFDALAPHRAGVIATWHGIRADPVALACRLPAVLTSMRWMLEAAGIPAAGPLGMLRAKGLLAVWLAVFRAWEKDESADLAATMAALDRALTRAESLAATFEPLLGRRPPEGGPSPGAGSEPDAAA